MNNEQLKRNVMRIDRSGDQIVTVAMTISRMASLFEKWLSESEPQPAKVPDGWKLVPVEPTPRMWDAGSAAYQTPSCIYHAMIAASPAPEVD